MMLWFILTAMIVVAAVGLTIPLVRRYDAHSARKSGGGNIAVLKDQLDELEARAAAEAVPAVEAEGLRTEIKRRVLAEGPDVETPSRPISERSLVVLALGLVAIVVLGAAGLYLKFGRPDVASAPGVAVAPAAASSDPTHPGGGDVAGMIGQLEAKMKQSPNDPEGWRMLGWSYLQTARYAEAATAYGRAAALDPKAEYMSAQGEAFVQAANGQVTPDARAAFKRAVVADPTDPRARYFLAVDKDQQGDHKGAMADWIALLKSAPADAPWAAQVRGFVLRIAGERGLDIAGQLPPAPTTTASADAAAPPAPSTVTAPGPTPDQVAAASQMPAADQQAMIQNMVEGLAARLKASPKDPNGWVRLMRARMVLNQPDAASAAYREALKTYAADTNQQAAFKDAARQLGVPGA